MATWLIRKCSCGIDQEGWDENLWGGMGSMFTRLLMPANQVALPNNPFTTLNIIVVK